MAGLFSEDLDFTLSSLMLVFLLLFTLAFEHCCELLEHKLNALEHYAQILDKCYRELTILGFISLCVVFSNEFNLWHDHSDLIAFEFAHLLIFGVSMVYVLTTVVACNRLEATSKSWKRIANADTGELIVDLEKVIESGGGDPNGFKPLWKSSMNIFTVDIWEDCCWKALRLMFLREFGLGVEFDYSKYVTTKLYQKLAHSLHVHPATWTLVMLISLLFFGYKSVSDDGTVVGSGSGAVDEEQRAATAMLRIFVPAGLGWVLTVGQIWVVKACTSTVVKMLKQNGCNCANDLPRMLREINSQVEMKNILPQLPMFCDCSDDFIETIHSNLTVNHYKPGETIYAEGDAGPTMIFICTGFADVRTKAAGGTVIGTLSHGDYTVGNEFPAAVSDLLDFSASAEDKALCGEWSAQKSHTIAQNDERVAAHAERLAELKAKKDAMNQDPDLKLKLAKLGGAARSHLTDKLVQSPLNSAVTAGKFTVAHAGIPGTGVAKTHAAHDRHHSLDRMQGADTFLPYSLSDLFEEISEITLLFNCFIVGYYGLHILPVLIPNNFSGISYILAHVCVMLPALLLMILLAPMSAKYSCLLDCVVYKDQDAISEVYHKMTQLIQEKNAIKKQLLKSGMKMAHDRGVDDIQLEIGVVAKLVFEDIDVDGGGFLDFQELRNGLARLNIFLTASELENVMECIDPNMDGRVSCDEWVQFLRASDEQLANDEWRSYKKMMAVRKHVSAELIRRVMAVEESDGSATVESLLSAIFQAMDTDNSNTLSDGELREGMAAYGLSLSVDDQQAISDYVARETIGGELTLEQWLEFIKAGEAELPKTSDPDAVRPAPAVRPTFDADEENGEETVTNPVKRDSMVKLGVSVV